MNSAFSRRILRQWYEYSPISEVKTLDMHAGTSAMSERSHSARVWLCDGINTRWPGTSIPLALSHRRSPEAPPQAPIQDMTLKLRPSPTPGPSNPFSWDKLPSSPRPPEVTATPPSPPTQGLSARDMKIFGVSPLKDTTGFVRCKDCEKPVLRSAMAEHAGSSSLFVSCADRVECSRHLPDHCLKFRNAAKKDAKATEAEGAFVALLICPAVNQDTL